MVEVITFSGGLFIYFSNMTFGSKINSMCNIRQLINFLIKLSFCVALPESIWIFHVVVLDGTVFCFLLLLYFFFRSAFVASGAELDLSGWRWTTCSLSEDSNDDKLMIFMTIWGASGTTRMEDGSENVPLNFLMGPFGDVPHLKIFHEYSIDKITFPAILNLCWRWFHFLHRWWTVDVRWILFAKSSLLLAHSMLPIKQ